MSSFNDTASASRLGSRRWGGGCAGRWHPVEIAAVVLGFAVWWPLGLGLLGLKLARRRGVRFEGMMARAQAGFAGFAPFASASRSPRWQPFAAAGTGNSAFDDWRNAEIARLEEERRKLDAAQKDFADHLDGLRRARDREEFDGFMAARRNASPAT